MLYAEITIFIVMFLAAKMTFHTTVVTLGVNTFIKFWNKIYSQFNPKMNIFHLQLLHIIVPWENFKKNFKTIEWDLRRIKVHGSEVYDIYILYEILD